MQYQFKASGIGYRFGWKLHCIINLRLPATSLKRFRSPSFPDPVRRHQRYFFILYLCLPAVFLPYSTADCGQQFIQRKHWQHLPFHSGYPSVMVIAPEGHCSAHIPHPTHFSLSAWKGAADRANRLKPKFTGPDFSPADFPSFTR